MTTGTQRPIFSRFYAKISARTEQIGMAELRNELLAPATGRVIEIGCGNGLNFTHYPPAVDHVLAIEPEPHLRGLAERAAGRAPVPVEIRDGSSELLPSGDGRFDTAVLCLVLCSITERARALHEIRRVLAPGGHLLFLEHTLAERLALRTVQRLADATVWPALTGGCHTATDPVADIMRAGFAVDSYRRLDFPELRIPVPASPHVLGSATR